MCDVNQRQESSGIGNFVHSGCTFFDHELALILSRKVATRTISLSTGWLYWSSAWNEHIIYHHHSETVNGIMSHWRHTKCRRFNESESCGAHQDAVHGYTFCGQHYCYDSYDTHKFELVLQDTNQRNALECIINHIWADEEIEIMCMNSQTQTVWSHTHDLFFYCR